MCNREIRQVTKYIIRAEFDQFYNKASGKSLELTRPGLKTGVENDIFWSDMESGFRNRATHPYQEFRGVPPAPGSYGIKCVHRNQANNV